MSIPCDAVTVLAASTLTRARIFVPDEIWTYRPMDFASEKVDTKRRFDVFVCDPESVVTGWHYVSTEKCAEWAWTLQNYIRSVRPWLKVRVMAKGA